MKCLRILIIGLAVAGVTLASGDESAAQFGKFKKKRIMPFQPQNGAPRPGAPDATKPADPASGDVDLFSATLLPAEFLARLKLTPEQKTETAKIQTEFAGKLKDALARAKDEAAKNGGKGAPGAGKGAPGGTGKGMRPGAGGGSGTPGLNEAIGLRSDYEEKVYDLLNEAQQKIWLDIKAKKGEGLLNGGATAGNKTPNKK